MTINLATAYHERRLVRTREYIKATSSYKFKKSRANLRLFLGNRIKNIWITTTPLFFFNRNLEINKHIRMIGHDGIFPKNIIIIFCRLGTIINQSQKIRY